MNYTLGHSVLSCAKTYFDYRLIKDLAAYQNKTVTLENYRDNRFNNLYVYGTPYSQFVYHSGISGVQVASGLYNPSFVARGVTGLKIDYNNARFLSTGTVCSSYHGAHCTPTNCNCIVPITATMSVREINSYLTTYSDSRLLNEGGFLTHPKHAQTQVGYLAPYQQVMPAAFFRLNDTRNEPFSLGGTDWTAYQVRILCAMNDNFKLTAIADMIRDMKNRTFPVIQGEYSSPFNEYGDIKAGWDYNSYLNNPPTTAFIDRASFAYIQNDVFADKNPQLEVGIGTLDIRIARNPHSPY